MVSKKAKTRYNEAIPFKHKFISCTYKGGYKIGELTYPNFPHEFFGWGIHEQMSCQIQRTITNMYVPFAFF